MFNIVKRISAVILVLGVVANAQDVYWEPQSPVVGEIVTIYYNLENRDVLPTNTNPCYIHLGYNDWTNTSDYEMVKNTNGLWQYEYAIPNDATVIDFVFTDNIVDYSAGTWDNNGGHGVDWHIDVYSEGLSVVVVSPDVENPYNNIFRSPIILAQNEILPITITTVTTGAPADSIFLMINGEEASKTNSDSLKFDFDTSIYHGDEYSLMSIGQDVSGFRDTSEFAIVVRTNQSSVIAPNGIKPGINYSATGRNILALFAPYKEYVYAIGEFNDWTVKNNFLMNKYEASVDSILWWLELPLNSDGSFQYLVDGNLRIADPYTEIVLDQWNDQYIPSEIYPNLPEYPHGKTDYPVSVIKNGQMEYQWQNNNFTKPEQKDLVIYELLIRDFVTDHNYQTLIDTLDYLENLGINAIELMPINEFEGNSSWGYNTSFYFAPDKYYGTADDFKAFIEECHRRGIAVIQDIVLNHSYGQSPLVRLYWDETNNRPTVNNPWYNTKSPNSVYSWGYDFDHDSKHTNAFVDRVLRYWIEEFKIDGFRLDFTKGFTNKGGEGTPFDASRIAILERIADEIWMYAPLTYIILEHFADNVEEKELADYGFLLWGNANHNYNEATMGYHNSSDFSWGYYKNRGWTKPNLVTYMESHDEERLMYKNLNYGNSSGSYNIKDLSTALDRLKLAAAFHFTLPGPKMIWQFGELGYDYSIDFNSRVGEKPIRWDYFEDVDRKALYDIYSKLLNIRNKNEVFRSPETSVQLSLNNSNGLKRIGLSHSSMSVIIIGNFGVETQSINPQFFYTATWYDDINGEQIEVTDTQAEIELAPGEFRIFNNKHLLAIEDDNDDVEITTPLTFSLSQNFPNPFNPVTTIKYNIPINPPLKGDGAVGGMSVQLKIYNILGNEVATLVNEAQRTGEYEIRFDASDLSNGLYFYTILYSDKSLTKKMMLLK